MTQRVANSLRKRGLTRSEIQCCGQCLYHKLMAQDEFMCDNENSEGYGLSTAYDDCCEEFEEREEE